MLYRYWRCVFVKAKRYIYTVYSLLGYGSIYITKIYLRTIKDKEIVETNNMISFCL